MPISFSPQDSHTVEKLRNAHWLPTSHGFSAHVATPAPPNTETAAEKGSAGMSMLVLVMRTLRAEVTESDAPFAASLERKKLSVI